MVSSNVGSPPQLINLPLAVRLTLASFLLSVGIGYCSALVQLHFQHASAGEVLPTNDDVVRRFSGPPGKSVLERIILAPESEPFSSSGSMRPAFTTQSVGWETALDEKAGDVSELPEADQEKKLRAAEKDVRRERDGEA